MMKFLKSSHPVIPSVAEGSLLYPFRRRFLDFARNDNVIINILSLATVLLLTACATGPKPDELPPAGNCTFYEAGDASWYGNELLGNRTANGEMFVPDGITAAHKTLPFGTMVRVMLDGNKGNPDGVIVRINDRGPFVRGRIIDLSAGAAKILGMKYTMPVHIYLCR